MGFGQKKCYTRISQGPVNKDEWCTFLMKEQLINIQMLCSLSSLEWAFELGEVAAGAPFLRQRLHAYSQSEVMHAVHSLTQFDTVSIHNQCINLDCLRSKRHMMVRLLVKNKAISAQNEAICKSECR